MRQHLLFTRFALIALGANILFFLGTGVMIIATPVFFHSIVSFPPFNRHYLVDAGIFQLALGLGLLWAILSPARRVAHIWIVTVASIMHVCNNLYDTLFISTPPFLPGWLTQTVFLFVLALALLVVALGYSRRMPVRNNAFFSKTKKVTSRVAETKQST